MQSALPQSNSTPVRFSSYNNTSLSSSNKSNITKEMPSEPTIAYSYSAPMNPQEAPPQYTKPVYVTVSGEIDIIKKAAIEKYEQQQKENQEILRRRKESVYNTESSSLENSAVTTNTVSNISNALLSSLDDTKTVVAETEDRKGSSIIKKDSKVVSSVSILIHSFIQL